MSNFIVPKNVKSRFEFFPGFGFKELILLIAGLILGGILARIVFIFKPSLLTILLVPLFGAIGFIIGKTDQRTGKNLLDLGKDFRKFQVRPKRYFYRHGEGRK